MNLITQTDGRVVFYNMCLYSRRLFQLQNEAGG